MKSFVFALISFAAASASAGPFSTQFSFVTFTCLARTNPGSASAVGFIDFAAKKARVDTNNGIGGRFGPDAYSFADRTGHADVLHNPANGWMMVTMKKINPVTSDFTEFVLTLQETGPGVAKVLAVKHGSFNPVSGMAYGYLALDKLVGATCQIFAK